MKKDFVILTDTSSDLGDEIRKKYNIEYVHSHILYPDGIDRIATLNWNEYDYFGENRNSKTFYKELKKNPDGFKTSPANIEEIAGYFEKYILEDKDIIYICLSSGISGAYNFALKARELVLKKYPDAKVECIDSLRFCSGLGLMVVYAAMLRNKGCSIDDICEFLELNKTRFHQMGWLDDLSFVAKKGRINSATAFMGTLTGVKSIGEVDYNGLTSPICKVVGEKKAFEIMLNYIDKTILNPTMQTIFISESNRRDKAEIYKKLIQERFNPKEVIINSVFPPCGINSGPGLLSAYYYGRPISKGLVKEKSLINSFL